MQRAIARWPLALLAAFMLQASASAESTQSSAAADHVAIQGYDVVSYFTDGKPVKGNPAHAILFDDAKWWFKDAAHKEMFAADPERYLPQYGGFCAGGMAMGVSVPANPGNWVIVDGKLYILSGGPAQLEEWKAHAAENIKAADKVWTDQSFQ
ncbi:YHS domain-containing (seleno)protein [Dongia deserti]|uniref:YHS domain-containing (seleno)protein n=1 Tax=Dongia deserti TaxID=2268030 RepID=UPI0013C52CE8|nr:YHS domain-containing (seleno)protein [Dongia deserti]